MENNKLYYCYNKQLAQYLKRNGFRYVLKARDIKNHKIFTCFDWTEELKKAIDEYYKELDKKEYDAKVMMGE